MAYLSRTCLVPVSYIPCGSRSTWDVRDRYEIGTREQHGRHTVAIPSHGYTIEPHRHLAGGSLPGWSCGEPDKKGISMDLLPACSNDRNVVFLRNYGFCRREREVELVLGCTDNRYMGHRVRARGLQEVVGRVPSRGDIANFCNQALAGLPVRYTRKALMRVTSYCLASSSRASSELAAVLEVVWGASGYDCEAGQPESRWAEGKAARTGNRLTAPDPEAQFCRGEEISWAGCGGRGRSVNVKCVPCRKSHRPCSRPVRRWFNGSATAPHR